MDYPQQKPVGHDDALQIFLDCWQNNQLHHAWLFQGVKGIGKASAAHYISRFILAQKYPETLQEENLFAQEAPQKLTISDMDIAADNPDIKLYHSMAHPNFIHMEKENIDGKMQSAITVEAIRNLSQKLMKTGREGYRVILIDAIDDLNRNAANAILKILEEPPKHTLFLLISHNPNKLLPTIISRCRRLHFKPLNQADMEKVVASYHDDINDDTNMSIILWLAGGAVGKSLLIMSEAGQKLLEDLFQLYQKLVRGDTSTLATFCGVYGKKSKAENEALFHLLIELYLRLFQARIFISQACEQNIPQAIKDLFIGANKRDASDWDEAIKISKQLLNGDIDRNVGLNRLLLLQLNK